MACGVPCVTTRVGDAERLVGDTGLVVPAADPAALADAIVHVLTSSVEDRNALGDRARRRIVEHFSLEATTRAYEALYHDVLANRLS